MKKIIAAFIFVCCFAFSKAQGNLQFNQVINYTLVGLVPQNFTVPAGKVWKIEAVGVDVTNTPNTFIRNAANQKLVTFLSSASYINPLPYWLSSGFTGNFYLENSGTYRGCISIIEFNIVP